MSPAPGVIVKSGEDASTSAPPVDIGTWFAVGLLEKGATNIALGPFRSTSAVKAATGERFALGSALYDAIDLFFREGGSRLYLGRVVGPSAVKANVSLSDGTSNTLKVSAVSPGEWGNGLEVVTSHPEAGAFKFVVKLGGTVVQESPTLLTNAEAVSWAATSEYIRLEDLGHGDPAEATKSLTGGGDDHANVTEAQWLAALNLFSRDLGPGQVSAPGHTTAEGQENVLAHCEDKNRIALLDGTDTGTVGTLTSQAATLRAQGTARYGGLFAPWIVISGLATGLTRTAPPCGLVAGLMARNDGLGLNPNIPAAGGENGVSSYAAGLSQANWSEAQREQLNEAGVNVIRFIDGHVEVYGDRTLVNTVIDPTWEWLSNARLEAYIKAKSAAVGERFVFRQIGKRVPAEFGSAIEGEVLLPLFNSEALFGESQPEAFTVDTGEGVNPPEQLAEGVLKAVVGVRMSPPAELIEITIVKEAV
jgi:phage tail sheath protein FI